MRLQNSKKEESFNKDVKKCESTEVLLTSDKEPHEEIVLLQERIEEKRSKELQAIIAGEKHSVGANEGCLDILKDQATNSKYQ